MAKHQEEQKRKKKSQEAVKIIETIGESGQKGDKAAKEFFDDKIKEEVKEEAQELDLLDSRRKFVDYNFLLAKLLMKRLNLIDWPQGWRFGVAPTDEGVVMEIYHLDKFFRAGFKPVMDPVYDLNAVDMYAVRAENTIDRIMGNDGETNGKIIT